MYATIVLLASNTERHNAFDIGKKPITTKMIASMYKAIGQQCQVCKR